MSGRSLDDVPKCFGRRRVTVAPARRRAQVAWSVEESAELPGSGGRPGEEGAVPLHGRTPAEKASSRGYGPRPARVNECRIRMGAGAIGPVQGPMPGPRGPGFTWVHGVEAGFPTARFATSRAARGCEPHAASGRRNPRQEPAGNPADNSRERPSRWRGLPRGRPPVRRMWAHMLLEHGRSCAQPPCIRSWRWLPRWP